MKKLNRLLLIIVMVPIMGFTQTIENLDFISPFNSDMASIKKNDQWAFINKDGDIVVAFRNDLVTTKTLDGNYPIFKDNRCLISNKKDGIVYYGYIDISGKTVIEPKFLNASNYENDLAIVLELKKEEITKNTALGKNIVNYRYFEVTIDPDGNIKDYLTKKGVHVTLDKQFIKKYPKITSKRISDNLVSVQSNDGKWTIRKIN